MFTQLFLIQSFKLSKRGQFNIQQKLKLQPTSPNHFRFNTIERSTSMVCKYQSFDDENRSSFSLKTLAVLLLGTLGLFGTGVVGSIQDAIFPAIKNSQQIVEKPKTMNDKRGTKTRMTRIEINSKLTQIPTFYLIDNTGAFYIDANNKGSIFIDYQDAEKLRKQLNNPSLTLSASTLDELYFPLVEKKQKIGTFINGVVGESNPTADYILIPSEEELSQMTNDWKEKHPSNDIPIFRVPNLAFSKSEGLEFPLFLRKEDAINSYQRLKETESKEKFNPATVQQSSIKDIVFIFSGGGFESRALEFYPSMDNIEKAREIINLKPF